MEPVLEYIVDGESSLEVLRSSLKGTLRMQRERRARSLDFYDTFDWRLFAKGCLLEVEAIERGGYRAVCRMRTSGHVLSQPLDEFPRSLAEWPRGRLRDVMVRTCGPRELTPIVTLLGLREYFSVLDGDDKIISQLSIDRWQVCQGSRRLASAPKARILISPLKGWEKETGNAAEAVGGLGVRPASCSLLEEALRCTGREPPQRRSKFDIRLSADQDAVQALREILLRLLDTMQANEAGVQQDIDAEFLHDFRIAVRRTRCALAQVKGVFRPEPAAWFREEFAWLGQATGAKRDLDVHVLEFDSQKALLPREMQADLEPLRVFLKARQASEREALNRLLAGERYRHCLGEWRRFLDAKDASLEGPMARRPAGELADVRIWKLFRKVVKQGKAIGDSSPPEAVHELRKTCKKLRYLMELFASLYPSGRIRKAIKHLKRLQDDLGAYQDQVVQTQALRRYAEQMGREAAVPKTLLAIGALIERIADRHVQTRAALSTRLEQFAQTRTRKLFSGLFKPSGAEASSLEDHRAVQH